MLAVVRPDAWNFPLFLHVAGAMLVVIATANLWAAGRPQPTPAELDTTESPATTTEPAPVTHTR